MIEGLFPVSGKGSESLEGRQSRFVLGEISGYTDKLAIQFMMERLNDLPQKSSVFFIGRYTFDSELLKDNEMLICRHDAGREQLEVRYSKRPDLQMYFITAHRSKGLQADYILIINNRNVGMGFPRRIQDAPILQILLEKCDRIQTPRRGDCSMWL
ncbi:MAG: hypothetical protein K2O34_06790 [Acetatifactor sp.]|nr:hypothetical protein [Acetatifactor sp.]